MVTKSSLSYGVSVLAELTFLLIVQIGLGKPSSPYRGVEVDTKPPLMIMTQPEPIRDPIFRSLQR